MKKFVALILSDVVFIMLINVKMPTIVGILTFISKINFVLSWFFKNVSTTTELLPSNRHCHSSPRLLGAYNILPAESLPWILLLLKHKILFSSHGDLLS